MAIIVKDTGPFQVLYDLPKDTSIVIAIGGRGGMKTYELSKFAAYRATIKNKRVQIVRDEQTRIKETILNEILIRYDTANKNGIFNSKFDRLEVGIKRRKTEQKGEEMVVFTKGMRASALDKTANLKGDSNVDDVIIEEAEDLRDEKKFNTFADGVRKEGSCIYIVLNTPDINHWIIRRFFNIVPIDPAKHPTIDPKDLEGYFDIEPKKIEGFVCIRTGYKDNRHLPNKIISSYEGYGTVGSSNYDLHHYLTSICGYTSTGRKGQYLKIKKIISVDEFLKVEAREIIGQDFGISHPAGMVRIKILKNCMYWDELNYLPKTLKELAFMYCILGFNQSTIIVADGAGIQGEPETIGKLRRGIKDIMTEEEIQLYPMAAKGFHGIAPCGNKNIKAGLSLLQSMHHFVTERSTNIIMEFANYVEARDRNGIGTGVPVDDFNHVIDPGRYVAVSRGRLF